MDRSNSTIFVLAIHVLSYLSIGLDISILRQCVGFIYLTFIPGFVILRVLHMKEKSITETLMLSVALSIAFVMFIGLAINTLLPFLGVPAPLLAYPSAIIMTSLTLIIFLFTQRKTVGINLNSPNPDFLAKLSTKGGVLYASSVLLLLFSVIGAIYTNTYLIILAIIGVAAFLTTCVFSKVLPSKYYTLVLFAVSLSLLYQVSLLSRRIMGYDVFREYFSFKSTRTAGYWNPPGEVVTFTTIEAFNSVLSTTILPTVYSTFLNVDGDLIFKVIYPFIFAFVPIFLYKAYESQSGKIVGLLSASFFIVNPINFSGLEPLSLVREMIGYLFFSAAFFSLLTQDLNTRNKRILMVIFSAALALSAYSLSFIYALFIVVVFITMRVRGSKEKLLNLSLVITILAVIFAWYMFAASPPLNKLSYAIHNIISRFTQDVGSFQARLNPQYALLSPTAQTSLVGLAYKILIYITHGFIVVGAVVTAIRPKIVRFNPEFRWMLISATFILVMVLAVPNVAPALNFSRFYRATMIFLSPLIVVGGMYLLDLFKETRVLPRVRFSKLTYKGFELLMLAILLAAYFLFSSGFVNYVSGGYPTSYPLNFNDMNKFADIREKQAIFGVFIPEQDIFSARWLAARIESDSSIYADDIGAATLFDYTSLSRDNTSQLSNTTQPERGSYIYLRRWNIVERVVSFDYTEIYPPYNISDISATLAQSDKIYSSGQSEAYYVEP